jgi:hypothetical protein
MNLLIFFFQDDGLRFSLMPNDLTIVEGATALFVCRSADPTDQLSWLKVLESN